MTDLSNFDLQRGLGWLFLLASTLAMILWGSRQELASRRVRIRVKYAAKQARRKRESRLYAVHHPRLSALRELLK